MCPSVFFPCAAAAGSLAPSCHNHTHAIPLTAPAAGLQTAIARGGWPQVDGGRQTGLARLSKATTGALWWCTSSSSRASDLRHSPQRTNARSTQQRAPTAAGPGVVSRTAACFAAPAAVARVCCSSWLLTQPSVSPVCAAAPPQPPHCACGSSGDTAAAVTPIDTAAAVTPIGTPQPPSQAATTAPRTQTAQPLHVAQPPPWQAWQCCRVWWPCNLPVAVPRLGCVALWGCKHPLPHRALPTPAAGRLGRRTVVREEETMTRRPSSRRCPTLRACSCTVGGAGRERLVRACCCCWHAVQGWRSF
jgi:hypothetical protein